MEPNKPSLEGEPLSVSNLRSTCKKAGNIIWPLDLWADEAHELLTHVDRLTTQLKNVKEDRELAMEAVETLRQERDRLTARVRELEAADRESHDLCCRLAEKIGIERSHRESLQCEVERLTKRERRASRFAEQSWRSRKANSHGLGLYSPGWVERDAYWR